jgi:hypothetical protein
MEYADFFNFVGGESQKYLYASSVLITILG